MAKRSPPEPDSALYVRLPADAVDKIDRAAGALGVHKKDLIASLVTKYVDPDNRKSLSALGAIANQPRRGPLIMSPGGGPTMGTYSFQAYDPLPPEPIAQVAPAPEVMNIEQTAQLLQVDAKLVFELAESGKLPGRKLGYEWRFTRTAILEWLAGPEAR